jgi:hypothetical protein
MRETGAGGRPAYFPFAGGPFRMALGLMPLAEPDWIETDAEFAAQLAEKRALLATRHDEAFAALGVADAPAAELLDLLTAHLPRHHAELFRRDASAILNRATGERWELPPRDLHPLELCGRLVQEDFCLLLDGVLVGATLAAPARWRLAEKIGRPVAALHAPVPGYDATLARPVDRFLAHLKDGRLAWRLNWGILDHPARFQPVALHGGEPVTAANAGALLWLRVERQSFRKLPRTGAVVFAIRTHISRLDQAVTGVADAAAVVETLRTMAPEMQRYKQIEPFAEPLLAWLEAWLRA